jgi:hypothetical protein
MKLIAIAAAGLIALQAQPALAQPASAPAQPAQAAPSEALIDRFMAVLPDRDVLNAVDTEVDPEELAKLVALNPGKEAQVRTVLQANLACNGPAIRAGTVRMLRSVARNLGQDQLQKLVSFYEGPGYPAFNALAARMEGQEKPSAADESALAKLMAAYPLQAYHDGLSRAEAIIAADQGFMTAAMKCASEQMEALDKAGLKSN